MVSTTSIIALLVIGAALYLGFSKRFLATGVLVLANIVIFILSSFGPKVALIYNGAQVGTRTIIQHELGLPGTVLTDPTWMSPIQFLSSMFVHADFYHLFGNVLILLAFALPFEERIGHRKFLAIYLIGGFLGALAQLPLLWGAPTIMMGASGAVFAIIGGFASRYPNLVLPLPVPLFIMMIFVRMRVIVAAALFGALQFLYLAFLSPFDNTAYLAHIGGLAGGALVAILLVKKPGTPVAIRKESIDLRGDLFAFARDSRAKGLAIRFEANSDEATLAKAWLESYLRTTVCPADGSKLSVSGGKIKCDQGHTKETLPV